MISGVQSYNARFSFCSAYPVTFASSRPLSPLLHCGRNANYMNKKFQQLILAGILSGAIAASADVLELKNGTVLSGKFAGGNATSINFETSAGMQVVDRGQAVALTFTTQAPAAAPAAVRPAAGAAAPPVGNTATLPAGTTLLVRLMDPVSSQNPAGSKFSTRLEYDLMAGNAVAAKAGTVVYGQVASSTQARRAVGKSTLDLRLTQIAAGGSPVPIMTSGYQQAGEESIRKAARGAAAGAAVGAIAGDAGKGAAIGATAGALKKGETVTVTPGTLLEFTLTSPVTINVQ